MKLNDWILPEFDQQGNDFNRYVQQNIEINTPPRNKQVKRMSSLFIVIIELVKFKIFGSNLSMRNFMMTFIKSRNNTSKEISNDNFL